GILSVVDDDLALEALGDLVGEVDVEALVPARQVGEGMRRERRVDPGVQRRQVLRARGGDNKQRGGGDEQMSGHERPSGSRRWWRLYQVDEGRQARCPRSLAPLFAPKSGLPDFGTMSRPKSGKPDFG